MPCIYDNKKIIPVEFITFSYEPNHDPVNNQLATRIDIQLHGKLSAIKGSPNSTGTFWTTSGYPPDENLTADQRLASILAKQTALKNLFKNDNRTLEIQPWDGSNSTRFQTVTKGVEFGEGIWFDACPFVIKLEAWDNTFALAKEASVQWNIELADEKFKTYRLTHSVSASAMPTVDVNGNITAQGWENAKTYVLNTLGLGINPDRMTAPGVLDANALQAFNYVRSQRIDERQGSFSVTESWVCYDPQGGAAAIDDFTVETRVAEDGLTRVSVQGTITGFEVRDNNTYALISTRWTNAQAKWSTVSTGIFTRAESFSGVTLNGVFLQENIGRNEAAGTITYHYEYDNRPYPAVGGALSEYITVTDHAATDVYASIPILGAPLGPVLQSIGTITAKKRSISIEIQMTAANLSSTPTVPNTDAIVTSLIPNGLQVFLDQDEETWVERRGRYTRSVGFTWK